MTVSLRTGPSLYLTWGAILWIVGFYFHYVNPVFIPPGAGGYLYGTLALCGGVLIGVGFDRLEFPHQTGVD